MSDLSQRYIEQLQRLKQSAKQFTAHYPALTEYLVRDKADPDVEMVLQGVAYISAELEQQINHQFPVALQALSQVLVPTLMQAIPSASMMMYKPKNTLTTPFIVPKGTYFDSKDVLHGSEQRPKPMRFQSIDDVTVLPIAISDINSGTTGGVKGYRQKQQLTIHFDAKKADISSYEFSQLPLFIHRPFNESVHWFKLLTHELSEIIVKDDVGETRLPSSVFSVEGLGRQNSVFNNATDANPHSLLQEYYLMPERLFAFQLDLSAWVSRSGKKFTIDFLFNDVNEPLPILKSSHVELFCVPVINRFSHYAEPIQMSEFAGEYPITARLQDSGRERSLSIIDVLSVESIQDTRDHNLHYNNVNRPDSEDNPLGYHYYRNQGMFNQPIEDMVALQAADNIDLEKEQVLRVKVDCCHGTRGSRINPGDISVASSNTPELIEFKNLTSCSEYLAPIIADERVWQVISDQGAGVNGLHDTQQLQDYLRHHLPIQLKGSATYQTVMHKINGIKGWSMTYADHVQHGHVYRGRQCELLLSTDHFVNASDSYLFASVIRTLVLMSSPVNCGLSFILTDSFSAEQVSWPFTLGAS